MSRLNRIQQALKEISPGRFQKLGDTYLKKRGYERINSLGSVVGSDKVRKGTPDSFIPLENGKYIFAEHTTISQENLFDKLRDDLDKCLDEEKTNIATDQIEEIIFCHTGQIEPRQYQSLIEKCKNQGINLNIFGVDEISHDLFEKYKGLAKDFLDVEVDTGQILSPENFVSAYGKNALTTPIDTTFQFRDEEIKDLVQKLEYNNLIFITGKAGVGKTRLALEGCRQLTANYSDYKILCIFNRHQQDLFEEIRVTLSEPGKFLILIDDANRISRFDYFVPYLQDQHQREDQKIKIIATVRDYAIHKILDIAQQYHYEQINIEPFTDDQIKTLVKKEFGIQNSAYLERIEQIAQGNPRLALMAGKIADEYQTLDSIRDVSNLYEEYFKSIDQDLKNLKNANYLKVAGIVAFYRAIDRSNEEQMQTIDTVFEIDPDTFWQIATELHSMEILDMYETEVVKISDQVLGTYLFYRALFLDKAISFSTLLNQFFPDYRQRFIDALNPVYNAFNSDSINKVMHPEVENALDAAMQSNDEERIFHLMNSFWFLHPTEVLAFVKRKIRDLPKDMISLSELSFEPEQLGHDPSLLKILGQFQYADENDFRLAVQLIFEYMNKKLNQIPVSIHLLTEEIGFHRYSWRYDYIHQEIIVDELWKRTQNGRHYSFSKIFLKVSNYYLKTRFRDTQYKSGNTISFIDFELNPSEKLLTIRSKIWNRIFQLYKAEKLKDDAFSLLQEYSKSGYLVANKQIVQDDATHILKFIKSELAAEKLKHCLFVQDYLGFLNEKGISFPSSIKQRFNSDIYKLANLLLIDRYERRNATSFNNYREDRKERIEQFIVDFTFDDYKNLFERCRTIYSALDEKHNQFQLRESLTTIFQKLASSDKELSGKVVKYYLKLNNPFRLNYHLIVKILMDCFGVSDAIKVINKEAPTDKKDWIFGILCLIEKNDITNHYLEMLYELCGTADRTSMPHHLDYLLKYQELDSKIVPNVLRILLGRTEEDPNFAYIFTIIFHSHTDINQSLIQLFKNDLDILKKAYFAALDIRDHIDYNSSTLVKITDFDSNFILEYLDHEYEQEDKFSRIDDDMDYSFIWLREDFMEMISKIAEHIYSWENKKPSITGTYFRNFFSLRENDKSKDEIIKRQNSFLQEYISKKHNDSEFMRFIFHVVCNFSKERRRKFISLFLDLNKKFDDFAQLSLEPSQWGWSGSAVPVYQERVEFMSSLLPLVNSVELIEHRQDLERRIKGLRERIKSERKRDFLRDY